MKGLFYIFLIRLSNVLGVWVFVVISRTIAAGYFIFFPRRVAVGVRFYRILFPRRSLFYCLLCTWKQYQNFTSVFLDRFMARDFGGITYTSEGQEHLEAALGTTGGIILMSHVGNWDVAAYLLKQKYDKLRLLLYMGIRNKEEIERIQKDNLSDSGIKIVAVDQDGGSPFDIMKGIQFIKSGGMVSLTGDVLWKKDQRTIPVKIFGHEVFLPEIPYIFALLSGVPLFIFFAFRTGSKSYHFTLSEPIFIKAASRADRSEAIRKSAQIYADILEGALRQHPFEWYHFEPFFTPGAESK